MFEVFFSDRHGDRERGDVRRREVRVPPDQRGGHGHRGVQRHSAQDLQAAGLHQGAGRCQTGKILGSDLQVSDSLAILISCLHDRKHCSRMPTHPNMIFIDATFQRNKQICLFDVKYIRMILG